MVLRRSTTRCTCPIDFRSAARSTVTFIEIRPRRRPQGRNGRRQGSAGRAKLTCRGGFGKAGTRRRTRLSQVFGRPRRSWDRIRALTPATAASTARSPRRAPCRCRPGSRSCARHAARWCDRGRRSAGRSRASERSVRVFARYIAICRGRTTLAVRREESRSARLTLYCRATTRWISSILTRFGSCGRIRSRTARSAMSMVTAGRSACYARAGGSARRRDRGRYASRSWR